MYDTILSKEDLNDFDEGRGDDLNKMLKLPLEKKK